MVTTLKRWRQIAFSFFGKVVCPHELSHLCKYSISRNSETDALLEMLVLFKRCVSLRCNL